MAQGNSGQRIVLDDADRLTFLRQLVHVQRESQWECLAYCLMDTHVHLVLLTPEPNLGRGMRWLIGGYAFSFNRRHKRSGHLFLGPYYSTVVEGDSHLIKACVYAVLNPVSAGVCAHPRMWPWSSYGATTGSASDGATQPGLLLGLIDDDLATARARYRVLVDEAVREVLSERTAGT